MGIAERKEREKAERKALILHCAKDLIMERGMEEISMGDIAKRAELSKATLYLYFPSRDILFREICIETGYRIIESFRSLHKPGMSALDSLKLFWNSYMDIFGKSNDIIILVYMKQYLTPDYPFISVDDDEHGFSVPSFELFNMIRNIIKEGIDEKVFEKDVNPTLLTHTIISMVSLIVESAVKSQKESQKINSIFFDEMKNIFQIILRGIVREGIDRSRLTLEDIGRVMKRYRNVRTNIAI
jgi:AcrR family transcriptional regulator